MGRTPTLALSLLTLALGLALAVTLALTSTLALTLTLTLTLTRCALPANASLYAAARTGPRGRPRCVDAARDRSGPEPCAFELDARVLVVSPLAAAPFNQAANPNPNPNPIPNLNSNPSSNPHPHSHPHPSPRPHPHPRRNPAEAAP